MGKLSVDCVHHWVIEPAKGETSKAVCKLCKATREFSNGFKRKGSAYNQWPGNRVVPGGMREVLPPEDYD